MYSGYTTLQAGTDDVFVVEISIMEGRTLTIYKTPTASEYQMG